MILILFYLDHRFVGVGVYDNDFHFPCLLDGEWEGEVHEWIERLRELLLGEKRASKGFDDFACRIVSGRNDKPTSSNACTIVGVWNTLSLLPIEDHLTKNFEVPQKFGRVREL